MSKAFRWIPAIVVMSFIFFFSSLSKARIPDYGFWDFLVKKGGHVFGYFLLAGSIWFGFRFEMKKIWVAWLLSIIYALSDEFHQSFVSGRNPSLLDVSVFDNLGIILGLSLNYFLGKFWIQKKKN